MRQASTLLPTFLTLSTHTVRHQTVVIIRSSTETCSSWWQSPTRTQIIT